MKLLNRSVASASDTSAVEATQHCERGSRLADQHLYVEAVGEYKKALRLDSELTEAYLGLAATYQNLGQLDKAIETYLDITHVRPDCADAYSNLGRAYGETGEFLKALRMHTKAIRLRPDDLELRKNLGLAYFNIGSYAEAIKAYKQALRIDPDDGTVHYYLGLVYLDLHDRDSALEQQRLLKELGHDDIALVLSDEIDKQTLRHTRGPQKVNAIRTPDSGSRQEETGFAAGDEGFSVIELLIVVAMVGILAGFALIQIVRSNQEMKRANAAQQFAAYLEKARLDSLRRRPITTAQMAHVSIINSNFYSITIDSNGDGLLDAPQVITLPSGSDFQFNAPFPRTIYFNWRGMTVDAAGAPANPPFVTISSATYGSSRIDLTTAGQPSLAGPPVSSPVTNSIAPAPTYRSNTLIP